MSDEEREILKSTKEFAKYNDIHYDKLTESMILNAMREISSHIHSVGAKEWLKEKGIHPTEPIYWDLEKTTISLEELLEEYAKSHR